MTHRNLRHPALRRSLVSIYRNPRLLELVSRIATAFPVRSEPQSVGHVIVAPPGGGNNGDQAMMEAFFENVPGVITAIVRRRFDIVIPAQYRDRVSIVELPDLVYAGLVGHPRDIRRFVALLAGASSFSIVGADIMDGAYNFRASTNRSRLAALAAKRGVPTRILGFSWNGKAHPEALRSLRVATNVGTNLFLRDPVSYTRAQEDRLGNTHLAADMVFASTTIMPVDEEMELRDRLRSRKCVLVNVSGLFEKSPHHVEEYVRVIEHILATGRDVILLPHVIRPGGDDLEMCKRVKDALSSPCVILVEKLLQPAQIRSLVAEVPLVISGRMHLGVIALSQGTPAIVLSSQGKVDGLMQMFSLSQMCVDPQEEFASRLIALVDQCAASGSKIRDSIRTDLPEVQRLASKNFDGLVDSSPDSHIAEDVFGST